MCLMPLTVACVACHAAVLTGLPLWSARTVVTTEQLVPAMLMQVRALVVDSATLATLTLHESSLAVVTPAKQPAHSLSGLLSTAQTLSMGALPAMAGNGPSTSHASAPLSDNNVDYWPTQELDMPPMPRSAPNGRYLDAAHRSGLPIRLRIFVSANGSLSKVDLVSAVPGDEDVAQQAIAMFRDTAFIPGRRAGIDVPSFLDVELLLASAVTLPVPLAD